MTTHARSRRGKDQSVHPTIQPDQLPTPLALALDALESETHPFTRMHRLIDVLEVLVKLHTVALICDYFARLEVRDEVRTLLAAGLATPSLGIWWQFARELAKPLSEQNAGEPVPGLLRYVMKRGLLFRALEGEDNLITLRNRYAHGATPGEAACRADLERYEPRLRALVQGAGHLNDARLMLIQSDGTALLARSRSPEPVSAPPLLTTGQCYLMGADDTPIPLHPLLVYRPADAAFYFYNDLRTAAASMLNYDACLHWRDADLRARLLERFPIDRWRRDWRPELERFRERIEALTESFKGRRATLGTLFGFLERPAGLLLIWGAPGVGKSALVARAVQILGWPAALREEALPELPPALPEVVVESYFIRRDQRTDDSLFLLENLNARIEERYRTGVPLGATRREMADLLGQRLRAVADKLGAHQRLLLCIDGLDEGADAEGLLESLPLRLPEGILIIYASRPHPRVRDLVYEHLDREQRQEMPLAGLELGDVRALLYDYVSKYALHQDYVEAVAKRSEGNPLYLKLLCEGLSAGDYRLNDIDRLPKKMQDIYDGLLKRLSTTAGAFDLLCLLAAARDYLHPGTAARLLDRDSAELTYHTLPACRELLQTDVLAGGVGELAVFAQSEQAPYQLFHESLRDYLRAQFPAEIARQAERLADWCRAWSGLEPVDRRYAVRHALAHLADSETRATERQATEQAAQRLDQLCALIEDPPFREAIFEYVGHANPLQQGIVLTQRRLTRRDRNGSELQRIVAYTRLYHDEPRRLRNRQLERIDACGQSADPATIQKLADLAQMGRRPRERVLLILRALWNAPRRPPVPAALRETVDDWLRQARDPALSALWEETLAGGQAGSAR